MLSNGNGTDVNERGGDGVQEQEVKGTHRGIYLQKSLYLPTYVKAWCGFMKNSVYYAWTRLCYDVMTLWLPSRLFWLGSQSQSQPRDSVCSGVRVRVDSRMWDSESESVHWLFKIGSQSQSQSQIAPVMSCDLWLGHNDDNLLRLAEKQLWLFDSRVDSLTLSRQL
jgi:hypothetical protein